MKDKAIVLFVDHQNQTETDLEISLDISSIELFQGLNEAFQWGEAAGDPRNCYFSSENPIALLRGTRPLKDFGIRDGSVIHYIRTDR